MPPTDDGPFRRLRRVPWNPDERRARLPIRLLVVAVLFLFGAGLAAQARFQPLAGSSAIVQELNGILDQLPLAAALAVTVYVGARWLDRRRLVDLWPAGRDRWGRHLAAGTALGAATTVLPLVITVGGGWMSVGAVGRTLAGGVGRWLLLAGLAATFQLTFVLPEELLARGYLVTNVVEGIDGVDAAPHWVAVAAGVLASTTFFYVTHILLGGRATTVWWGAVVATLATLLGVGYVVTGSLAVPVGIHFGANYAGVLVGHTPHPASLVALGITDETIAEGVVAPPTFAVAQVVVAAVATVGLLYWHVGHDAGVDTRRAFSTPSLRWSD